ncbi:M48 family metallopeptidase [Polycladidibacter stylochi]|uniref:M48 family metallopeptidase n=1 Tax=Polycladidibacter stylochi TaxID=1807766 RepID=UPI00083316A2|nr:SprT family zinc-dependent metalloprotease [Pseudovibrio stylochi]
MRAPSQKLVPDHITISLDGEQLQIRLRRNARAKRYVLRLPVNENIPTLTIPRGGTLATAKEFAQKQSAWLQKKLQSQPEIVPLIPNSEVPLRGQLHMLKPSGALRGKVTTGLCEHNKPLLLVPGDSAAFSRRVKDFFKQEATGDIEKTIHYYGNKMQCMPRKFSLRDTKSRWGSCSAHKDLSFSWRLILAPPFVLEYVVAHEMAHLVHMNHSDSFWQLCHWLEPDTTNAQKWLKMNGSKLHLIA